MNGIGLTDRARPDTLQGKEQDPANGQRFYVMPATGLYRADFTGGPL